MSRNVVTDEISQGKKGNWFFHQSSVLVMMTVKDFSKPLKGKAMKMANTG